METKKFPGEMEKKSGERNAESPLDRFYQKLRKLNEPSGLSLVEATLDLHCLYKEVINRGGFYQVTKIGKWDEVASAPHLKSSVMSMSAAQLQNVYETLLLQYELMYSRKMPEEGNTWPDKSSQGFLCLGGSPSCSTGKRKHCESSSPFSFANPADTKGSDGPTAKPENSSMITLSNTYDKELIVDRDEPMKPRTGYQIFLRLETHRLKMIHGESSSTQNLRDMAISAWRCLPEKDKLPYIEASKMDKERYDKEMAAYNKQPQNKQNIKSQSLFSSPSSSMLNFSTSSETTDDVYHVSLDADSENLRSPDESVVELAIEAMKNAESNDPIFQIDLDCYQNE